MRATILFLAFCAFALPSLSMPTVDINEDPVEFVTKLGQAATYDRFLVAIDAITLGTPVAVNKLKSMEITTNVFGTEENIINFFKTFGPAFKALVRVWKATVPKGAAPTDEELTDLAKKLSKAVRDIPINKLIPKVAESHSLMTEENIEVLADLIASHPASEPAKIFVNQLKEKSKPLYCTVLDMKKLVFNTGETTNEVEAECSHSEGKALSVIIGHLFKENFENLRSEENAIGRMKAFATFVNTITNTTNFQNYDTLYRGFSRNEYLEAFANIIRETRLCYMEQIVPERKEEGKKDLESFPLALQQMIVFNKATNGEIFPGSKSAALFWMITMQFSSWEYFTGDRNGTKFMECLMPESDKEIYKGIILTDDATVSDAKLKEIKAKSKRAHGVLFLLNTFVKAAHRRDGLSENAEAFYKKVITVPHVMTKIFVWLNPFEEMLSKKRELKQKHIRDFDALTPEVKKELVKRFPYQALSVIAQGEL